MDNRDDNMLWAPEHVIVEVEGLRVRMTWSEEGW
jgi:hypothetical protein